MIRLSIVVACALIILPATGSADTPPDVEALSKTPQALLEALDKRHNHYETQKWTFEMSVVPTSGAKRSMQFEVLQKGKMRLVRFLSPGEVKGMSVLSKGSTMYVYAPQTDNVRRIATSARRQNLLGSNLTYADMATVDFAPEYTATVSSNSGNMLWLDLEKKPESDVSWAKLRFGINKKHALIEIIEYWEDGKKLKTQTRKDFATLDGAPTWKTIVMKNASGGLKTELKMLSQKINEPIPSKIFSKRSLVRGR